MKNRSGFSCPTPAFWQCSESADFEKHRGSLRDEGWAANIDPASAPRGRVMNRSCTVAALVAAIFGGALAAQQPSSPTFGTSTRTVAVYATVSNAQGRLVTDLKPEDFSVEDNGKRQVLTVFSNDIQPITIVMLLDRSGSMKPNFGLEEQAAAAFVAAMGPADKARIGSFSNRIQIDPPEFTSDRGALDKILP